MDDTITISEGVTVQENSQGSRQRRRNVTTRQKQKILRYQDHFPNAENFEFPCAHNGKTYKCLKLSKNDIIYCRQKLYSKTDKIIQDVKLSHYINVSIPKRRRSEYKEDCREKNTTVSVEYFLRTEQKTLYRVCQKMFLNTFGITQKRIQKLAKIKVDGREIKENRGGDHRSHKSNDKRESVRHFIGSLKGHESHYNRSKSKRLYLPSNQSISNSWKLYNSKATEELKVKSGFFKKKFSTEYNIGFGSPASDVCSFCFRKRNELKRCNNRSEQTKIMAELRIHKMRAKQFHLLMKEETQESISFCFDMQQVQCLPKLPIREAFYLRQLAFYCFCITDLKSERPVFYTWSENLAGRGSNEVSSALIDFLRKFDFPATCTTLRLFADGCSGQNKNHIVMNSLALWLYKEAPLFIKDILVVFPVRGHSYLPADRVFARVEKMLKKQSTIMQQEEYWELYEKVGAVRKLGEEWNVQDYKRLPLKKLNGIKDMKRIKIKKDLTNKTVKIKMEQFYRNDNLSGTYQSITTRGKKLENILKNNALPNVELKHEIKKEKIANLKTLLNLYDENWQTIPELQFYKNLFDESNQDNVQEISEGKECDCNEDDCGLCI